MRTHNHCNNWGFCVFVLYSFCMILICFHVNLVYLLIERVRLFRFLFCSPDGCNGQCWTRLKPGAGNFFQVSHVDHQGAGSEMEQWGHNPLLIWDIIYCMWQFNSLSHNSGPIVFFIRLLICFHFFPLNTVREMTRVYQLEFLLLLFSFKIYIDSFSFSFYLKYQLMVVPSYLVHYIDYLLTCDIFYS